MEINKAKILDFLAGRKILILSLAFLLAASTLLYSSLRSGKKAEAAWWDESWLYRKAVNITNSSGSNLTDFQVSFTLDTASLISAGKMQSDCDDIRITDQQSNLLPHWIEENNPGCNNSATKIWTKVPSLPTSGTTIYVYYGNPSATNTQSGDKVFEFFDDFNSDSLNFQKWQTWEVDGSNAYNISGGKLQLTGGGNTGFITKSYSGNNYRIVSRMIGQSDSGLLCRVSDKDHLYLVRTNVAGYATDYFIRNGSWSGLGGGYPDFGSWANYRIVEFSANGNSLSSKVDGIQMNTITNNTFSSGGIGLRKYGGNPFFDWIYVIKYASSDPSSSLSSEEQSPGPVAYWKFDEGTGTTTYDSTANKNNGTISGASWQTEDMCAAGKCLYFDGTNDVVTVSNSVGNIKTVSFWVKPITTSEQFIDLNGSAYIQSSSGTISATGFTSPTIYVNGKVSSTIEANKWQHVVVTTNTAVSGSAVKIAQISSNYGQVFIDEVKLYPYARSAAQVLADYNAGKAKAASTEGVAVNLGAPKDASAGLPSSLSEGLVGYWKMDESSWTNDCSTATVIDSSGNGNHGKSCPSGAGSQPTTGKFGNAGYFDGSNDYVDIGNKDSLNFGTQSFTASFWVKNPPSTYGRVVSKMNYTGTGDPNDEAGWYVSAISSGLDWGIGDGTNIWTKPTYSYTFTTDQWYLITGVFDREKGFFYGYVNGSLVGSTNISQYGSINNNRRFLIGRRDCSSPSYFNGFLDEVRVYNRALSPAEVRALYEWAPGPVAHFKLDDGSGTSPIDSSGFGRTGSIINGIWSIGKYGKGLKLDGSGDYLEITDF
uniref:DUF2341 domain-containing protein n=1 Tax=candidate division CPR3 bacterium TaxID=2268181 RepID=A0A7V3J940_UNCC3